LTDFNTILQNFLIIWQWLPFLGHPVFYTDIRCAYYHTTESVEQITKRNMLQNTDKLNKKITVCANCTPKSWNEDCLLCRALWFDGVENYGAKFQNSADDLPQTLFRKHSKIKE